LTNLEEKPIDGTTPRAMSMAEMRWKATVAFVVGAEFKKTYCLNDFIVVFDVAKNLTPRLCTYLLGYVMEGFMPMLALVKTVDSEKPELGFEQAGTHLGFKFEVCM
jgi:hypothetical protein